MRYAEMSLHVYATPPDIAVFLRYFPIRNAGEDCYSVALIKDKSTIRLAHNEVESTTLRYQGFVQGNVYKLPLEIYFSK